MKTILKNGKYLRVADDAAHREVARGASYAPKSKWKEEVRDLNKEVPQDSTKKKSKNEGRKN